MRRWTRRVLLGAGSVILVAVVAGATYERIAASRSMAATPPPGRMVDIGGHRLHIWCTGAGSPEVVLESGLGGSTVDWGFVQPEVARFTRVCSYDRAGLGYSDPGPRPRTARRIARELHALLDRSGVAEPLVLVGASSGGLSMRIFATEHQERLRGLVLVDASHEDQPHEVPVIARFVPALATLGALRLFEVSFGPGPDARAPAVRDYARATHFRASGYRTAANEITHMHTTANEVRGSRRPLTIPVLVVTGARGADAEWQELQRDQTTLSSQGCQIVAEQSGHVVTADQPEVVVNAIRALVDAARGRTVIERGAAPATRCDIRPAR
jgi:pimeloyl-ACP methyl ester carboxylesterase